MRSILSQILIFSFRFADFYVVDDSFNSIQLQIAQAPDNTRRYV